jgi:hypothetical protein
MTAKEFIAKLPPGELDRFGVIFHYLSDHIIDARLQSGMRLIDLTDVRAFLYEVALAARIADPRQWNSVSANSTCPRCGHVHQGSSECGQEMEPGRICRCEIEVGA